MKPLLSIIIATKNRVPFCINVIETILKMKQDRFELVIQDNTDNLDLQNYLKTNINDSRLIYNYTPPPFSSINNFNAALQLANGEYVCMIGDDDCINPEIFSVVEWAKKFNIDSICPKVYSSYIWPSSLTQFNNGFLSINKFNSALVKVEPKKKLPLLLRNGMLNYMHFDLPKVYHGILKKDCLEKLCKRTGYYFGGLSPDIYSAVALSDVVKNHYTLDYPLTISGACNQSATIDNLKGKHTGKLEAAPHFRDRGDYIWDIEIPRFYSVQTIWAESAFKAIREHKINVNLKKFNRAKLIAHSLFYNRKIYKLIITESNKCLRPISIIPFYLSVIYYIAFELLIKIFRKVVSKIYNPFHFLTYNVKNIEEATKLTLSALEEGRKVEIAEQLNIKYHSK